MGRKRIRAHELKDGDVLTNESASYRRKISDVEVRGEYVHFRYPDLDGFKDRFERYADVFIWVEPDAVVEDAEVCTACGEPLEPSEVTINVVEEHIDREGSPEFMQSNRYHLTCLSASTRSELSL